MRRFLWLFLLIAIACAATAQQPTEWKQFTAGGVTFQIPAAWADRVTQNPSSPDGTVFAADFPNEGSLRIRVAPGTGDVPKPRQSTRNVLQSPEWNDLLETIRKAGFEMEKAEEGRSDLVNGVLEESLVVSPIQGGVKKGFRLKVFRTSGKVLRAELVFNRQMPRPDFDRIMGIWTSIKYADNRGIAVPVPVSVIPTATQTPVVVPVVAPAPVSKIRTVAEIVQDFRDSLVFIEGGGGSGSGFIYKTREGVFLLTNQHVVAEMPRVTCTRLDGTPVKLGAGGAAVGHDEIRFLTDSPPMPFEIGERVENFAKIGDEIVVLGNAEGSRVITPLRGQLVGIGPDRIEVDAEFVPGNSGSPIIHIASGRAIGIATYLEQRRYTNLVSAKEARIRRFGYRLDSVKQWQPVNWAMYQGERFEVSKVGNVSKDFAQLLEDIAKDGRIDVSQHANSSLSRIINELDKTFGRQASPADRQRAMQTFITALRSATQSDITAARARLRYDFFLRQLNEEAHLRDEFYKIFDKLAKQR